MPWKAEVTSFLHNYRATPHSTTGVSPFELLRGRKMRTKLNIFPPQKERVHEDVRRTVRERQCAMKVYTDTKRGAKAPRFKCGDNVRIRKPMHVHKADARFTGPLSVKKQIGPSTYILSDGKKWNATHLTLYPENIIVASRHSARRTSCNRTGPRQAEACKKYPRMA